MSNHKNQLYKFKMTIALYMLKKTMKVGTIVRLQNNKC